MFTPGLQTPTLKVLCGINEEKTKFFTHLFNSSVLWHRQQWSSEREMAASKLAGACAIKSFSFVPLCCKVFFWQFGKMQANHTHTVYFNIYILFPSVTTDSLTVSCYVRSNTSSDGLFQTKLLVSDCVQILFCSVKLKNHREPRQNRSLITCLLSYYLPGLVCWPFQCVSVCFWYSYTCGDSVLEEKK